MKRKKPKGVVYEDVKEEDEHPELTPDSHGHAQWKVEVPGAAAGLGVPRSQIMDTGKGGGCGQGNTGRVCVLYWKHTCIWDV